MYKGIRSSGLALLLVAGTAWGGEPGRSAGSLQTPGVESQPATRLSPPGKLKKQGDVTIKGKKITDNAGSPRKIQDGASNTIMVGEIEDTSNDGKYTIESVPHRSKTPAGQRNQTDMEFIRDRAPASGRVRPNPDLPDSGGKAGPSLKLPQSGGLNKKTIPGKPGMSRPSLKKPSASRQSIQGGGAARQRAGGQLRHTVSQGLTMRGLGSTRTTAWEPIEHTTRQSLAMRGLGDTSTTVFEPIDITVTTPLTMSGLGE